MRRSFAILITLIITISILPVSSMALRYGMDTPITSVDHHYRGEDALDTFGAAVNIVGDVDNDGIDDFAVTAPNADGTFPDMGETYLLLGRKSWPGFSDMTWVASASFMGASWSINAGNSVAPAGDVNGDGYDDFIIGAVKAGFGSDEGAGETYVIFGRPSGWAMETPLTLSNASYQGGNLEESSVSLAGAGDVNGDGFDDFLIGAHKASSGSMTYNGKACLILGKSSGWKNDVKLYDADACFFGEASNDNAGWEVAGVGDVNNDGLDDFAIGARYNDEAFDNAGQAYLFFGKRSSWSNMSLSEADASFHGEASSTTAGSAIAGPSDVNGDGIDDLIISSPNRKKAGEVYIFFGKESGWAMDTSLSTADASFTGELTDDWIGNSLAPSGDVNGDGFGDVFIGAAWAAAGGFQRGAAYLNLGKATNSWVRGQNLTNSDASFLGQHDGSSAASEVSGGGDVNGDGYDDLLVGAKYQDHGADNSAGSVYIIFPELNSLPSAISSVKAYSDPGYSVEITQARLNDTVYVEVEGNDADALTRNLAQVMVSNPDSGLKKIRVRLIETGLNTGLYRGNFEIRNRTHDRYHWINASPWQNVTITSMEDGTKSTEFMVIEDVIMYPLLDNGTAIEDQPYLEQYHVIDLPQEMWSFDTNADWLQWNDTTHELSGTPDNADVGSYWVDVGVSCYGLSDSHNFTVDVANTPPTILNDTLPNAVQDRPYTIDIDSDDDGQGDVTWELDTDVIWLNINTSTGVMNGTPSNADVGVVWLNITVNDGNGGSDTAPFNFTVSNVNDPPVILTNDTLVATEDELYSTTYVASDIDANDVLTWEFSTNATSWLSFNSTTGVLEGTPTNDDVDEYWVNVTVRDLTGAKDVHDFTLTVQAVNDPPVITSTAPTEAWIGHNYSYEVMVEDLDSVEIVFSLDEAPQGMSFSNGSNILTWVPSSGQEGLRDITINVSDGEAFIIQSFQITVKANNRPIITSEPPLTAVVGHEYLYNAVAIDPDGDEIVFSLRPESPTGMTISSSTGMVEWVPTQQQVGEHMVTVWAADGKDKAQQVFYIKVYRSPNEDPVIVSNPTKSEMDPGEDFEYTIEARDVNTDDVLTITLEQGPPGMVFDANTSKLTWSPTEDQVGNHDIVLKVTDGRGGVHYQNFTIVVKEPEEPPIEDEADYLPYILAALVAAIVAIVLAVYLLKRKKAKMEETGPIIDDIFLIYKDGRLLSHHTRQLKPDVDDQILGGMFTAVQEFLKSSFGGEADAVNEISYGEKKIIIEHGPHIFIAAVLAGGEGTAEMHERMKAAIHNIEVEKSTVLEDWSGDTNEVKDAKKWLAALIRGEPIERL